MLAAEGGRSRKPYWLRMLRVNLGVSEDVPEQEVGGVVVPEAELKVASF